MATEVFLRVSVNNEDGDEVDITEALDAVGADFGEMLRFLTDPVNQMEYSTGGIRRLSETVYTFRLEETGGALWATVR
jgi:hypothetical protein